MELLPALQRPADFDEALAASRSSPAKKKPSGKAAEAPAPSVLDALTTLNTQCTVFKRSATALGAFACPLHAPGCLFACISLHAESC